jgi:hypothetical protein
MPASFCSWSSYILLAEDTLIRSRRVLGEDHPVTEQSLEITAWLDRGCGRPNAARTM